MSNDIPTHDGKPLRVFNVEDGESHLVVATSRDDAIAAMIELRGLSIDEYVEEIGGDPEVSEIPWTQTIRIRLENTPGTPPGAHCYAEATALSWARHGGRGVISSTCY